MYNRIFLTFALLMASFTANAQSYYVEDTKTFYGALILGTGFTQVDGDNYAGYHKFGWNVGGAVYTNFSEHMCASMEILYSQKGSNGGPKESGIKYINLQRYNLKLNYAEVPVQLYFIDKHRNHFGGGFSYGRLVSNSEDLKTFPDHNFNVADYPFRKHDVSFVLSGNARLIKGLFVNVRFQYSLLPIRTEVPYGLGRNQQFNNSCVFRFMYMFGT